MSEHDMTPAADNGGEGVDWDRYEAEVTDAAEPDEARVLVDSPQAQRVPGKLTVAGLRDAERAPLLPAWAKSREDLRDMARWTFGHAWHWVAYHAIRAPKYAGRLAMRAPRGASRLIRGFTRWVLDMEGEPLRQVCARREDPETYLKLSRQRDARVRWRGIVAVPTVLAVLAVFVLIGFMHPPAKWLALAAIVGGLGVVGRKADQPVLDTAVLVPRVAKLTSDVVVRALSVIGLQGVNQALAKNPNAIGFAAPITRDGPGWRADVDLPFGVTAAQVMERREQLASGLGRPQGCVWPEGDHDVSPGRLRLWVGDQDMAKSKPVSWPLARTGRVDLFGEFPYGTDPRGRAVSIGLMFNNMLIGAMPRYGKTFAVRIIGLAAALDPRCELWVFELKGSGDLEALEKVSARYVSGNEDEECEATLIALRALSRECSRRAKVIKSLPRSRAPEHKITPELAGVKSLGLHPLAVLIDECQRLFKHPTFGKEAGALAEDIIRTGPAFGILLVLATQRPDKDSLPTGVSANAGTRFCLRVMGQMENDMILGTSQYKNGVRASMFTKKDKGVGYLVGEGEEAQITRTYYIDAPTAEKISQRARAAREAAGTITGHAAGQETPTTTRRDADALLGDLLTVLGDDAKAWNETLAGRLADLDADAYDGWTGEQLTLALKPLGVSVRQVWATDPDTGKGTNRRGVHRAAVAEALAQRQAQRRQPPPDDAPGPVSR